MSDRQYFEVRSFGAGSITATTSAEHRVAVAIDDGTIVVVDAEGETHLTVDRTIADFALGEHLFIADSDSLSAMDLDGHVQWSVDVTTPSAVEHLPGAATVIVGTEEEYIGFDAKEGSETFRIDRPHADVAATHELVTGTDSAIVGAWWFLTAIAGNGEIRSEVQVDGAIRALGSLGELAVTLLKGGRLVAVDMRSGEQQWAQEAQVDWLASRGDSELLMAEDRSFSVLGPDGQMRQVGTLSPGRPVVAASGDLLCIADGSDVRVFRHSRSVTPVTGALRSERATPGTQLEFAVENKIQEPVETTFEVESSELSFESRSATVELEPGASSTVGVPVSDATGTTATVRILCTGIRLVEKGSDIDRSEGVFSSNERIEIASGPIPIGDPEPRDRSTVETGLTVEGIENGALAVTLSICNPGGEDVRDLECVPTDLGIDRVPVGETVTQSLVVPLDTEEIHVVGSDTSTTAAVPPIQTPPIEVSVDSKTGGFVDITLRNRTGFELRDDVTIRGDYLPEPITRSLVLDPEETIRLVLPTTSAVEDGTVEIDIGTGVKSETVTVSEPAIELQTEDRSPADPTGPERPASDGSASGKVREQNSLTDKTGNSDPRTMSGERPESGSTDSAAGSSPESAASLGEQLTSDRSSGYTEAPSLFDDEADQAVSRKTPSGVTTGQASDRESVDSASKEGEGSEQGGDLEIERSLAAPELQEGLALQEDITVTAQGRSSATVWIASDEQGTEVEIPGGESVELRRFHTAYGDAGTILELPVVAASDNTGHASLPTESIPLVAAPFRPRISFIQRDGLPTVRVEVDNNLSEPVEITGMSIRGLTEPPFDTVVIGPGESVDRELTLPESFPETPCLASLQADIDGTREEFRTVASMPSPKAQWVDISVADIDAIDDGEFNLTLVVQNQGATNLTVNIQARGDAPDEYLYSGTTVDELSPSGEISHRIECTVDETAVEIPIDLESTVVGAENETTLHETVVVAGRVGTPPEDWTVERGTVEGGSSDVELLTTPPTTEFG
jgi:hypothetical protein